MVDNDRVGNPPRTGERSPLSDTKKPLRFWVVRRRIVGDRGADLLLKCSMSRRGSGQDRSARS
ncbi:MAG: hypothetical protein R3324_18635, partial [Halobacteriales archaeon]|nr:hypothetical protein [Halobacteriales archaeon]